MIKERGKIFENGVGLAGSAEPQAHQPKRSGGTFRRHCIKVPAAALETQSQTDTLCRTSIQIVSNRISPGSRRRRGSVACRVRERRRLINDTSGGGNHRAVWPNTDLPSAAWQNFCRQVGISGWEDAAQRDAAPGTCSRVARRIKRRRECRQSGSRCAASVRGDERPSADIFFLCHHRGRTAKPRLRTNRVGHAAAIASLRFSRCGSAADFAPRAGRNLDEYSQETDPRLESKSPALIAVARPAWATIGRHKI